MDNLYFIPPSQEAFDELKEKAIEIYKTKDNKYDYSTNKIDRIKSLINFSGNFMYIVSHFDSVEQEELNKMLSIDTKLAIRARLLAHGHSPENILFK